MNSSTVMGSRHIFQNSIIVASHPDDEVLWFSSILERVDEVLICFLNYKSKHEKSMGRKKALSEYPKKNISCLGLDESGAFWDTNWQQPVITQFGLEINDSSTGEDYRDNYYKLKSCLQERLKGYSNVFTHNPWGEYGHVEHVQVYRVIKELQGEMKFSLWYNNYYSNKSLNLFLKYCDRVGSDYVNMETNKTLAISVKALYEQNGCWSWFSDHEWCNEESFIRDQIVNEKKAGQGKIYPLNFINLELTGDPVSRVRFGKRVAQLLSRYSGRRIP
jgi:hypothetical protein